MLWSLRPSYQRSELHRWTIQDFASRKVNAFEELEGATTVEHSVHSDDTDAPLCAGDGGLGLGCANQDRGWLCTREREGSGMHKRECVIIKIWLGYWVGGVFYTCPQRPFKWDGFLRLFMVFRGEKDVDSSVVVEWRLYLLVPRVSLSLPSIQARDIHLSVLYCSWMFCPSVVHCFGVYSFHFHLTYKLGGGEGARILLLPFSSLDIDCESKL